MVIPKSVKEIFDTLETLEQQKDEGDIAFAVAGAIYIASWKSGMFKDKGELDDSLFFKFSSCIDNKLRPNKTMLKLSGVFLNFAKDKIKSAISKQSLQRLIENLDKAFEAGNMEQNEHLMKALLQVRSASNIYVFYSSELSKRYQLKDIELDKILNKINEK